MRPNRRKSAFTLVEILVVLTIVLVVGGALLFNSFTAVQSHEVRASKKRLQELLDMASRLAKLTHANVRVAIQHQQGKVFVALYAEHLPDERLRPGLETLEPLAGIAKVEFLSSQNQALFVPDGEELSLVFTPQGLQGSNEHLQMTPSRHSMSPETLSLDAYVPDIDLTSDEVEKLYPQMVLEASERQRQKSIDPKK